MTVVKTHSNNLVVLAHVQLKPFYRLSTRDVTHVRKCTRPSPALPYCKQREAGRGPGKEATFNLLFEACSAEASSLVPGPSPLPVCDCFNNAEQKKFHTASDQTERKHDG